MSVLEKFKKDIKTIKSAVEGEFYLDVKNPKLYKKLLNFYKSQGVDFSNDVLDNYDILMDNLVFDFKQCEIIV